MKKPVLLVVMDGVGFSKTHLGDAVTMANTPTLDEMLKNYPNTRLKAHGPAVGLPSDDDMGNSEVGHNALGCGQIYSQGAKLVNESISSGKMYESEAWHEEIENVKKNTEQIKETDAQITELLSETNAVRNGTNESFIACMDLYNKDYTSFSVLQKKQLGALVNNTKALSTLLNEVIS